jgi:hypothetical protein
MSPFRLAEAHDGGEVSGLLLAYYRRLAEHEHPWVAGGGTYRLLRDLVLRRDNREAQEVAARLRDLVVAHADIDLFQPEKAVERYRSVPDPVQLIRDFPTYFGPSLYYIGMRHMAACENPWLSARYLGAGFESCSHSVRLEPAWAQEASSLLASANFHALQALRHVTSAQADEVGIHATSHADGLEPFRRRYHTDLAQSFRSVAQRLDALSMPATRN